MLADFNRLAAFKEFWMDKPRKAIGQERYKNQQLGINVNIARFNELWHTPGARPLSPLQ